MTQDSESKYWVEKVNVPLDYNNTADLKEWRDDTIVMFNGNRWKKIWYDHRFVKENKDVLTNLLVDMKETKALVSDCFVLLKQITKNMQEMEGK